MHHPLIRIEAGWFGMFTRNQAPGALANGTRVVKIASDPSGDAHGIGAQGSVLGSIGSPTLPSGTYFYFIEWDDQPRIARGCVSTKVRAVGPLS